MSEETGEEPVEMKEEEGAGEAKQKPPVIHIFPDWCKGCGICVAFCPKNVLEMGKDQKAHVVRVEDCIRCYFCARRCPDLAITVMEANGLDRNEDPDTGVSVDTEEEGGSQ
jgi:2-oxoglutarate ferredoxin oxidoreductase subunit delta